MKSHGKIFKEIEVLSDLNVKQHPDYQIKHYLSF